MTRTNSFILIAVVTLLFSCKPSQRIMTSWVNPERPDKKYSSVFVAALLQQNDIKFAIEDDLGAAAKKKGFNVVKGYEIFPPNFNKDNMRDKEVALNAIRKKGCDVILTIAVVDTKSETRYVSNSVSFSPYAGYGGYGPYGGGFYGYYSYYQPYVYESGYYETKKTYFLEATAFDMETQAIIWQVQSKAQKIKDVEKSSKEYTELLMDQFEKDRKKS